MTAKLMDHMVPVFSNVFKSERLVYKYLAYDSDPSVKEFFWNEIFTDPVGAGLGIVGLLAPPNRAGLDKAWTGMLENQLLAVLICLSTEEAAKTGRAQEAKDSDSSPAVEDEKAKEAAAEPRNKSGPPIGFLTLRKSEFGGSGISHNRSTAVGIQLSDRAQGKGYGREAIEWAIGWGFQWAGLHRIAIGSVEYNERALALYEKMGFVHEGRMRKAVYMHGKWWDMVQLSMLVEEWQESRGKKLEI